MQTSVEPNETPIRTEYYQKTFFDFLLKIEINLSLMDKRIL